MKPGALTDSSALSPKCLVYILSIWRPSGDKQQKRIDRIKNGFGLFIVTPA